MNAVKPRWDDYSEDVDCGRCGGAIEDSFSFCPWCGAEIEWDEPDPLYVDRPLPERWEVEHAIAD